MSTQNKIWLPGSKKVHGFIAGDMRVIEGISEKTGEEFRLVKFRVNMHQDKPIPYRMVVAPARVGQFAEQNLRSGDKVEVTGRLSIFKKEDETGVLKERYEMNASWIELLEEAPEEQNLFNPALTQEDIQDLSEEAVEEADETLSAQLYNDED